MVMIPMLVRRLVMRMRVLLMRVVVLSMRVAMILVRIIDMNRPFVDAEFHAFHAPPSLPLEVHVKAADVQLCKLPFERGRADSEVAQSAYHHVAADAGEAV